MIKFLKDESGISSVEYGLLLAMIGGAIILAVGALSDAVSAEITNAAECIKDTSACQ